MAAATEPGKYADGDGLYLVVTRNAGAFRKRWLLYFAWQGKRREMGLGSGHDVSLADARRRAEDARRLVREGIDPIAARKSATIAIPTFGEFADRLVDDIEHGFRNAKHRYQWRQTLTVYAAPIRSKPVDAITTADVLACLEPIWQMKQETASRLRGRIERVLDAAKARGHRTGENPARWRGHLDNLLPRRQKLLRGHHPAMPYKDVPDFVARLRERQAVSAFALEFTILTAGRTGEVLSATWAEVDRELGIWTVPASRMKAGREHRVPLIGRALEILDVAAAFCTQDDSYVFPGARPERPLSNMAFVALYRRMDVSGITTHGFRSSFRDWAAEETVFPREVAEAALAHVVGDATERAYRRGDALEKRRQLMRDWGRYLDGTGSSNVIPLAGSGVA